VVGAVAAGDLAAARAAYEHSIGIAIALAADAPANARWQRDLSLSYLKLADVAMATGDLAAARAAYQASLDIVARLAAADPADAWRQRDLSVSHERFGGLGVAGYVFRGLGAGHRRTRHVRGGGAENDWGQTCRAPYDRAHAEL
jgi:hypothetical protein